MAKVQTVATRKYMQKVGLISKSYKLKKSLTEEFAQACQVRGVSASAAITEFMENFIAETPQDTKNSTKGL